MTLNLFLPRNRFWKPGPYVCIWLQPQMLWRHGPLLPVPPRKGFGAEQEPWNRPQHDHEFHGRCDQFSAVRAEEA